MTIFVMSSKWLNSLIAWCDLSAWTIVQGGKKLQSGGERSETSAVKVTSAARKHRRGRSGNADERAELTHSGPRGTSETATGLERERDAGLRRKRDK